MARVIDIFRLNTDPIEAGNEPSTALLDDSERERAERFRFARDRRRFLMRRNALRRLLAGYLGVDPARIRYTTNAYGKLALPGSPLGFSLSQSADVAFFACAEGLEIGCDIEACDPAVECLTVAQSFFSPREIATLEAAEPSARLPLFYDCWTRKEAYVKARGYGLALPLAGFSVPLTSEGPASLLDGDAGWRVAGVEMGPSHRAAVAASGDDWRLAPLRALDA